MNTTANVLFFSRWSGIPSLSYVLGDKGKDPNRDTIGDTGALGEVYKKQENKGGMQPRLCPWGIFVALQPKMVTPSCMVRHRDRERDKGGVGGREHPVVDPHGETYIALLLSLFTLPA